MSQAQFIIQSAEHEAQANAAADANDKVRALFPQQDDEAVGSALEMFNQMSRQITDSYRTLESRVNQLSGVEPRVFAASARAGGEGATGRPAFYSAEGPAGRCGGAGQPGCGVAEQSGGYCVAG